MVDMEDGDMNNPMYNPMFLAGLSMMQGTPTGDAYGQAAVTSHNVQQAEMQRIEAQRAQMMAHALPGMLQQLQGKSSQEIFAALVQGGADPKTAALIAENMGPSASNLKEDVVFNPVTGEAMHKRIQDGTVTGFNVWDQQPGGTSMNNMAAQGQQGMPSPQMQQYSPGFEAPQRNYETPVEAKERRKAESDTLKDYQVKANASAELVPTIDSLRQSLDKFETGIGGSARKNYAKAEKFIFGTDVFGINPAAAENIESKGAELVMPLVERNKGAASDKDMTLFLQTVPSLSNTREGNKLLVDAAEAINLRGSERYKAATAYKRKFGTLEGFVEKWDGYVRDNRILTPDESGNPRLNKQNVTNWRGAVLGEADQSSKPSKAVGASTEELLKIARGE